MGEQIKPEIDVLMSVYNGEAYLALAIQSVLDQTHENFRFIIVDDGSTDSSAQIITRFSASDPRIKCIHGPHKGLAAALNAGLRHVTAPLVARMDADDICMPNRLSLQLEAMNARPEIAVLGTSVQTIDKDGRVLRQRTAVTGWPHIHQKMERRNCIYHPSTIIRTNMLEKVGGYRDIFLTSQDYDLWLRILAHGKIDNLPDILLNYRKHEKQTTDKSNTKRQTLFSVAAAVNYFLDKYGLANNQEMSLPASFEQVGEGLIKIYQSAPPERDLPAINRHTIRLLTKTRIRREEIGQKIKREVLTRIDARARMKLHLYCTIRR